MAGEPSKKMLYIFQRLDSCLIHLYQHPLYWTEQSDFQTHFILEKARSLSDYGNA